MQWNVKTKCTTNSGDETITSQPYKIIFGNVCDNDGVNWGLLKNPSPESTDTVAHTGSWSAPFDLKLVNNPTKCPVTCALST